MRPEGWTNLFHPAASTVKDRHNKPISHYDAFEYGADAMLESLLTSGLKVNNLSPEHEGKGTVIFIHEEE